MDDDSAVRLAREERRGLMRVWPPEIMSVHARFSHLVAEVEKVVATHVRTARAEAFAEGWAARDPNNARPLTGFGLNPYEPADEDDDEEASGG